jgi:hypothetical protein
MTQADSVHSTPRSNAPVDQTRRSFLSTAAAGIAAGSAAIALASPPARATDDPIFAAIEGFKVAEAILDRATAASEAAIENGLITNVERWDAQDRCHDEVFQPALRRLISTTPMTPAGLVALLGFVREAGGALELIGDEQMAIFERSLESAACTWAGHPLPPLSQDIEGGDADA